MRSLFPKRTALSNEPHSSRIFFIFDGGNLKSFAEKFEASYNLKK